MVNVPHQGTEIDQARKEVDELEKNEAHLIDSLVQTMRSIAQVTGRNGWAEKKIMCARRKAFCGQHALSDLSQTINGIEKHSKHKW